MILLHQKLHKHLSKMFPTNSLTRLAHLKLFEELAKQAEYCIDTETTGLDITSDEPIGISLSFKRHEAYYISLQEKHLQSPEDEIVQIVPKIFSINLKLIKLDII